MKRISMTYGQVLFELGIKKESLQKAQDMLHENEELKRKTDKIIKAEFDYVTMPKDEQLERIKQYLMKQYQADKVELTLKEEKDLIGGFVLKVGDHVYDNSLSGKMRKLQQKLTWR